METHQGAGCLSYSLVGCSNSTNTGTMAAEKEKAATSENKEVTNAEENYELGEIKITNMV